MAWVLSRGRDNWLGVLGECATVCVLPVLLVKFPLLLAATSASMTLHLLPRRVVWHGERFMKKLRLPPFASGPVAGTVLPSPLSGIALPS